MLLAGDALQASDTLEKEADMMVGRESTAASIELLGRIDRLEPGDNMS